jgi:hypothetical protein
MSSDTILVSNGIITNKDSSNDNKENRNPSEKSTIRPILEDFDKLQTIENYDVSKFDLSYNNLVPKVQLFESYIYLYSPNIVYVARVLDEFIDMSGYQHGTIEFIDNQKRYNKVFLPRINQRNLYYLPS